MLTWNLVNGVNILTYLHVMCEILYVSEQLQIWQWCETLYLYITNLTYTTVLLNAFTKITHAYGNNTNINAELRAGAVAYWRLVLSCACTSLFQYFCIPVTYYKFCSSIAGGKLRLWLVHLSSVCRSEEGCRKWKIRLSQSRANYYVYTLHL